MKRRNIIIIYILGLGLLSAAISFFPHSGALSGDMYNVQIFWPGLIFGIFTLIVLSLKKENQPLVEWIKPFRFLVFVLFSTIGYAVAYVSVTIPFWFIFVGIHPLLQPLSFAAGGTLGSLILSLGLLVTKEIKGKAMFQVVKLGALLSFIAGIPFFVFLKQGGDMGFPDGDSSLLSFASLFLIWQPAMLWVIYREAKKKKDTELNAQSTVPTPPIESV